MAGGSPPSPDRCGRDLPPNLESQSLRLGFAAALLLLCVGLVRAAEPDPAVAERLGQMNAEVISAYERGDFDQGGEAAKLAYEYAARNLDPEHPDLAPPLINLAEFYRLKGDTARAEPLLQRALAISEKSLGPEHQDVATSLNNLAALYWTMGDYARAEPLYQRSLAIWEKTSGPSHPDVALSLTNLAELYLVMGDYTRAEPLLLRSLAIWEKNSNPEQPDAALALNNLAVLYHRRGDDARAELLFRRSLAIREKTLGPSHPDVAESLNNLADIYRTKGDYDRAERALQRSLTIWEKFGPESPDVARSLNNLAVLYRIKGEYARAEPLYKRSLAMWESVLGPEHPDLAQGLKNVATFYRTIGDYAQAEPLLTRSLTIREKALGSAHPEVASSLNDLASLYWAQEKLSDAITLKGRAVNIEEHHLRLNIATGSEAQKRAYIATLDSSTGDTLSLHLNAAPEDPDAARLALATLLQRKGRVLDALAEGLATLRDRLTPEDRTLLDQLMAVRSQLANWMNRGPGPLEPAEYRARLAQLEAEADRLEARVSSRSAEFRAQSMPVTLERVQQALPAESALLEVAVYQPFKPTAPKPEERWGTPRYVAYVLFPQGEPRWVELGEAKIIDQTIDALRETLRHPLSRARSRTARGQAISLGQETPASANPARTLDELVMRPIRKRLGDTHTVFFSPDGALNLIPVGALVDENGHYLIEDYHFTYLTSGRDLLRLRLEHDVKGSALVLADPDFGPAGGESRTSAAENRGRRSADLTRDSLRFVPLPGTAQEAKAIAPMLQTQPITRDQATESVLKQVHQPAVLHIATHGFFLPDQPHQRNTRFDQGPANDHQLAAPRTENPLLRSGLALAGANRLESGNEDGILTALEASGIDLWGTQLVVLSACETGVGKIQPGEGVYGLRRALVNAGAETQVMSLWKVDDAATRDLMVDYYRRLKAGEGRSEALRQAQLAMLHSKDRNHPYYWASFIVSGDWRPLRAGTRTGVGQVAH